MRFLKYFLFFAISYHLSSCDESRIYEDNIDIKDLNWEKEKSLEFDFIIEEPDQLYNLYYNIRYTNTYPYYNLFTRYFIYDSSGKEIKSIPLPDDMYLFDPKTGEPYGSGIGDIYDHRISFLKDYKFPYSGKYKARIFQYMRKDSLPGIVSFGLRIEKAQINAQ
jgi:gliding motility-associated lipoprotein GldH